MRRQEFTFDTGAESATMRHRARALHFNDQSIFSYSSANKHWWGYA